VNRLYLAKGRDQWAVTNMAMNLQNENIHAGITQDDQWGGAGVDGTRIALEQ
jgi:hypothetical protein